MKNFNYLCLSLVLVLFACTKEVGMQEVQTTNEIEVNTDGTTIDAQRAINSLFSMLNEIDSTDETRSGSVSYRIINQELVEMKDVVGVTRADSNEEVCAGIDNNFYIVNFEDDKGRLSSAVLGASENLPPVLAIMNGGDLSSADFQKAWQKMQNETTANPLSASLVTDVEENTAPLENIISFLSLPPATPGDKPILTPGTGDDDGDNDDGDTITPKYYYTEVETLSYDWVAKEGVGPLLYSHFNQVAPFNNDYDVIPNSTRKYYAGCGIVALAQILSFNKIEKNVGPSVISGKTINWRVIETAINKQDSAYKHSYRNIKTINVCTETENEELAKLHRAIFDSVEATTTPDGTYLSWLQAKYFLENRGCKNVTRTYYRDDLVVDMLVNKGLPIYTQGWCTECDDGHAWVIDGRRRFERYANNLYIEYCDGEELSRYSISEPTGEEDILIHCNWGYEGDRDGYFHSGIFDSHNAICTRSTSCDSDNYSEDTGMIFYNL